MPHDDGVWRGAVEARVGALEKEVEAMEGRLGIQLADVAARIDRLATSFDAHRDAYITFTHRLMLAIVAIIGIAAPGSVAAVRGLLGMP